MDRIDPDGLSFAGTTPKWGLDQWEILDQLRRRCRKSERPALQLLQFLGVAEPPVRMERICNALGLQLKELGPQHDDIIGKLEYDKNGQPVISVRGSDPYRRQRFTVAHEIGHLLLHPHLTEATRGRSIFDEPESNKPQEREANRFAANLLMPGPLVQREIARGKRSVHELADAFRVSEAAMEFQLRALGHL